MLTPLLDIAVNRQGYLGRREFVANLAGGAAAGVLTLGWRDMLVAQADELRKKGKSIILLWMDGGPSQFDTFNPKVGSPNQGPARAISTSVAGVFMETHPDPDKALSDGPNAWPLGRMRELLET